MAKQRSKSGLFGKLGAVGQKAFEEHKGDDTSFDSGGSLPGGIEGGIAQLVDCKFGTYEKGDNIGEYFFYAAGIVKRPLEHGGIPIEGLRTKIGPEPICDTPNSGGQRKTMADHFAWILNQLRMLGLATDELENEQLEEAMVALVEEKPHFRFRTWKGKMQTEGPYAGQEPRVNEVWGGACEHTDEDEGDGVVDTTGDTEPDEPDEPDASEDLMEVAEAADADDDDAVATITAAAEEAGINHEEHATWVEVAEAIAEGPGDDDDEDDDEDEGEEDFEPVKGKVYSNKFPKTRKRVEVEVTAIFPGKKTCNLKRLDDGKVFKGQSWDSLEEIEGD